MRRLIRNSIPLLLILALTAGAGCKRRKRVRATAGKEETGLATMVFVADPKTSLQLLRGFHEIEQNAWRWTKSKFAVTLKPPPGASQTGAPLVLKFSIAEPIIQRVKSMTISANVDGTPVESETFTKPGDQVYRKDIPGGALRGDAVTVDFAVDKYAAQGEIEDRELAIIVSAVGFEAK
jgi:hypothetical protein